MMSDDFIARRVHQLLAESGPLVWWWLSFADRSRPDGDQWLGVCIVYARNIAEAAREAHFMGCNPGGEVMGEPFGADEITPPPGYVNRLLTEADIDELKDIAAAERKRNMQ